jgi:hypothetical protein
MVAAASSAQACSLAVSAPKSMEPANSLIHFRPFWKAVAMLSPKRWMVPSKWPPP